MSVQAINGVRTTPRTTPISQVTRNEEVNTTAANTSSTQNVTSTSTGFDDTAAVYEKTKTPDASVTVKNSMFDREAIIAQMKADTEARMNQMTSLVQQTIAQQGNKIGMSEDVWSFLAKGDFTVSPDVKAQAQADIAEDGYWGVEKTSDRILEFAKALSGNDPSKADELLDAFKTGFKEATKTWGKDLPDISQKTYEAVEKKFAEWKAETDETKEQVTEEANKEAQQNAQKAAATVTQTTGNIV
ncbi:MAG: hypothetical protein IKJ01_06525 [Lachnospiraceae bacterium]|nr:hypothetical protein [Lachnospiraceae bacterium]